MKTSVSYSCLLLLLFTVEPAAQQSESQLSEGAISSYVRSADPELIDAAINEAKDRVRDRAANDPDDRYLATVIPTRGLSIEEIDEFTAQGSFEIARVEFKVLVQPGVYRTISIGPTPLLSHNGSVHRRVQIAIGKVRARYLERANLVAGTDEQAADKYRSLAYGNMKIYKFEAVGLARHFESKLGDSEVAAIFPEESNELADSFDRIKQTMRPREIGN